MGLLWVTISIILLSVLPTGAFYIHPQNPLQSPHFVLSPIQKQLRPPGFQFPLSGQMVRSSANGPFGNVTNKIVVVPLRRTEDDLKVVQRYEGSEILAMLVVLDMPANYPGLYQYMRKRINGAVGNAFPVFEITDTQDKSLDGWFANQTRPNGVSISFESEEANPWKWVFEYWLPIFANLLLVLSGGTLVMAVYKMILLVNEYGFQISMAQMVIVLNIQCLIIRALWLALDPFGAYGTTNAMWVSIGQSVPFGYSICAMLLIISYWHEMIHLTGVKINTFLSKLRIPFWIAAFILIGGELANAIVRGLGYHRTVLLTVGAIVYTVMILSLLIFFITTKVRLNHVFRNLNESLNQSDHSKLSLASNIVLIMSAVMVGWLIALLMMVVVSWAWTPEGFVLVWTLLMLGNNIMCLMQVLLIRAPYRPWRWIFCGLFVENPRALFSEESNSEKLGREISDV